MEYIEEIKETFQTKRTMKRPKLEDFEASTQVTGPYDLPAYVDKLNKFTDHILEQNKELIEAIENIYYVDGNSCVQTWLNAESIAEKALRKYKPNFEEQ
jgi:hypothetical protein